MGVSWNLEDQVETGLLEENGGTLSGIRVQRLRDEDCHATLYKPPVTSRKLVRGAEIEEQTLVEVSAPSGQSATSVRLYPSGQRLGEGEATKSQFHSPHGENGKRICWDSDAHDGCFSGVTCMNSHVRMKHGPLRRCLQEELIRSGETEDSEN